MDIRNCISVLALSASLLCCGCQMFSREDDALTSYERMREELTQPPPVNRQVTYEQPVKDKSYFDLENIRPDNLTKTVQSAVGQGPSEAVAKAYYQKANALYQEASKLPLGGERVDKFSDAAELFLSAAARWPDTSLEEDALFMAGEAWFFSDHFTKSRDAYDELVKKYRNTRYLDLVDRRRFALAEYWHKLHQTDPQWVLQVNLMDKRRPTVDTRGNAIKVWDRIRRDDPTGSLADDATMAIANAYFAAGKYIDADEHYEDVRRTFPDSQHQFNAHLLAIKCKQKIYQGPDYDGKPLEQAEELIQTMQQIFPDEAREHREFLETAWKEVRAKGAMRQWAYGQYYDGRGEYGAARFHYGQIIKDFDDTSLADKAQERMAQIQSKPDVPPDRFTWITRWFPRGGERPEAMFIGGKLNPRRKF